MSEIMHFIDLIPTITKPELFIVNNDTYLNFDKVDMLKQKIVNIEKPEYWSNNYLVNYNGQHYHISIMIEENKLFIYVFPLDSKQTDLYIKYFYSNQD